MHIGGDKGRSFVKIGVYSICLAKVVIIVHALRRQYLLCMPCEGSIYYACLVKADFVFLYLVSPRGLGTPSPILVVPLVT